MAKVIDRPDEGSGTGKGTYALGVSRPPLEVLDLPTPEEVFGVEKVGAKETLKYAIGPAMIALGISVGSGEWLLGPLAIGTGGFRGFGWVILLSALLQVFYCLEIGRYVVATGEVPVVGFGRVPPGYLLWVPFALFCLYFANILGGWAAAAGQGLMAIIEGEAVPTTDVRVKLVAIGLLVLVLLITLSANKITRALELIALGLVAFQLITLFLIDLFVVPGSVWTEGILGFITPALPPGSVSATVVGGLAGFTALASGLNWYIFNHYRDKGYGMGHRMGFIAGMRGESKDVLPVGATFPDDAKNAALWKRWMHFLHIEMWGVFFGGAILGMLLPTLLMRQAVLVSGREPTEENLPTFIADVMNQQYGRFLFYLVLVVGFLLLFDTQLAIFEALVRNFVDAMNGISGRFRTMIQGDPRRFYFPYMVFLIVVISFIIFQSAPTTLILITANMSNFGALFFPFVLMYLNSKLPKPARPPKYTYVMLALNVIFFGFFFINFVWDTFFGGPLIVL